jgi:hypothetical protein
MQYTIPYLLLLFFYGILAFYVSRLCEDEEDHKIRVRVGYVCFFVFLFFFGFRGFCFDDWQVYHEYFNVCTWDRVFDYFDGTWNFEPGFSILMMLCKSVVDDYQILVFVTSLIDTILLMRFMNKEFDNVPLAMVLFLSFSGIGCMMNIVRNMVAIFIFLNSLEYLWTRQPIKYFALIFVAMTFHTSSVLYIPLYFFLHRESRKWLFMTIFIIGNLVLILRIPIFMPLISLFFDKFAEVFQDKIEAYTDLSGGFVISIGYLERLLTGILIICYYDKLKEIRPKNVMFINLSILYFILFFFFSEFEIMSRRLSNLFVVSYWVLWSDMIKCFSIENNKKLFVTFLSLYCIMRVIISTNGPIKEYENVLLGAKSYQERLYIYRQNFQEEE